MRINIISELWPDRSVVTSNNNEETAGYGVQAKQPLSPQVLQVSQPLKCSHAANQHLINTKGLHPLSPPCFHLYSDLPSEWNGDCGLVKTKSVDSLRLIISTSTGSAEAKKEYIENLDMLTLPRLSFPPQSWRGNEIIIVLHRNPTVVLLKNVQTSFQSWLFSWNTLPTLHDYFELECQRRRNSIWPTQILFIDNWSKCSQVSNRSARNRGLGLYSYRETGYLMVHLVSRYNQTRSQVSHRW